MYNNVKIKNFDEKMHDNTNKATIAALFAVENKTSNFSILVTKN